MSKEMYNNSLRRENTWPCAVTGFEWRVSEIIRTGGENGLCVLWRV